MNQKILLVAAFLILALSFAPRAGATTVIPMTTADLSEIATVIVDGTVTQVIPGIVDSYNGGAIQAINTHAKIKVIEGIKGLAPETAEIRVVTAGGVVGRKTAVMPGEPKLITGKRVLLFLWKNPFNEYRIAGQSQGLMFIQQAAQGSSQVMIPIPNQGKPGVLSASETLSLPISQDLNAQANGIPLFLMKNYIRSCLAAQMGLKATDPTTGKPFIFKKNPNLEPWRKVNK